MSVGCKIIRDFERPSKELVESFKDMPVANIDDCMSRTAAVDSAIKPVGYKGQLLGTAFTVKVAQGDNLMFHAAMDMAKPGDVIVIDADRQRAVDELRAELKIVLAQASCKSIPRSQVHAIIDEIYDAYDDDRDLS